MRHFYHPQLGSRKRKLVALTLLLLLLACGGGYLALQFNRRAIAAASMTRTICVALETTPRVRLGMYWSAPIFSSLSQLTFAPYQACFETPYTPAPGRPWLPREWLLIP